MIKDKLERAETYYKISENLKKGFEWLKSTDLETINDGKYIITNDIYANVQSYETKDFAPFEAHKKYIDIQYMINGKELVEITDLSNCKINVEYNEEKDIEFLDCYANIYSQTLATGEFLILFPHDAHKPALKYENKKYVKKVIVKVGI